MSAVRCPHECGCDCRIHDPNSSKVHAVTCCEGRCVACPKFIHKGMQRKHLIECHQMSDTQAEQLMNSSEPFDIWSSLGEHQGEAHPLSRDLPKHPWKK